MIRLQKYLSQAGICSRRKGEEYIKEGLVKVNSKIVTELGTKIDPEKDLVEFSGRKIEAPQEMIYIMLHKPRDYVTSCSQPGDMIVLDLIDIPQRLYPIGRLDKDSTGLLLLTNNGDLHQKLSHPSFSHEKEYEVTTAIPIPDTALKNMEKGLTILGKKTRQAETKRLSSKRFRIIIKEGKNRQIRRMVGKVGNQVASLKRIRVSSLKLGALAEGNWRHLTKKEQDTLLNSEK